MRRFTKLFVPLGLLLLVDTTLLMWAQTASSPPQRESGEVLHGPPPSRVSLFVGGGDKSPDGRRLAEQNGVTPYDPNRVVTLEQLTRIAIAALKKEGREVLPGSGCSANIELSTGTLTILLRADKPKESCHVSFDKAGQITRVGGVRGSHGEGRWHREYTNGQPVGAANGSKPIR
jgi:hypothetical protein